MQWGGVSQISFETWDIVASELKYQSQSHNVFEEVDDTVVKWETGLVQRGKKSSKNRTVQKVWTLPRNFFPQEPDKVLISETAQTKRGPKVYCISRPCSGLFDPLLQGHF